MTNETQTDKTKFIGTITRRQLVDAAFETIEAYEERVTQEDRNHLLYAACTMPQVALGDWVIDTNCGCLVGTMMLNEVKLKDQDDLIGWDPTQEEDLDEDFDEKPKSDKRNYGVLDALGTSFDVRLWDLVSFYDYDSLEGDKGRVQVLD